MFFLFQANTPTGAGEMAVMNTFELKEDITNLKKYINENIITKIKYERSLFQSLTELLYSNINVKLQNERSKLEKAELYLNENNPLLVNHRVLESMYGYIRLHRHKAMLHQYFHLQNRMMPREEQV